MRLSEQQIVILDGHLDEAFWGDAPVATDFLQVDPENGKPATERTEVRIVYNTDTLYLGVTCFDSEPDKWLGYQRRRDEFLSSDDRFMWTIDTFLDARSGYFFEMNPSGLMGDSLMGGGIDNRQWDGIWNAQVHRSEMGWARNQGLRRMTNAGFLTGIRDVSQGLGLDVKPYALATRASSPGRGKTGLGNSADAGVDVFYSPTPGLRSVLTVNTDFAQTEVDQRQVNLTRYSLFFPEKRDFFLDGAPYFAFGSPLSGDLIVNPFFSRRIGLTLAGAPQTINYGAKLTGQMGRQDVGFLQVKTGEDAGTTNPNGNGDDSFGFTAAMPNDLWNLQMSARHVGATFDPAVGFVTRRRYRRYQPSVEYGPRPRGSRLVRRYAFGAALDVQTDLQNALLVRAVDLKVIDVNFHSQDGFSATVSNSFERLDAPYSPSPGIILPRGSEYTTNRLSLKASTANRRVLALSTIVDTGGFYSGTRNGAAVNLTYARVPESSSTPQPS